MQTPTSISSNTVPSASAISTPCKRLRVRLRASGFPVNYLLTMKKGKQLCGKLLTPLMAAGLIINLFIGKSTPLWVVIVSIILYNFGFSGPGFTATNIQPDVTDVDEMITGRRREGVISTFNTLIKRL